MLHFSLLQPVLDLYFLGLGFYVVVEALDLETISVTDVVFVNNLLPVCLVICDCLGYGCSVFKGVGTNPSSGCSFFFF